MRPSPAIVPAARDSHTRRGAGGWERRPRRIGWQGRAGSGCSSSARRQQSEGRAMVSLGSNGNQHHAEADEGPRVRGDGAALRGPALRRHIVDARRRGPRVPSRWQGPRIHDGAAGIGGVVVLAPLPEIPIQVTQSPRVGQFLPDGMGFIVAVGNHTTRSWAGPRSRDHPRN